MSPHWMFLAALAFAGVAAAEAPAPVEPETAPLLSEVVVTGEMPGPGLWRVSRGDNELWLLGTLSPLPKRFRWRSDEVEQRVAASQLLLAPPAVDFEAGVGRIRALFLLPSLLGARRNPDDAKLADVLPPELYARWQPLKQRHLKRNRKVETWRPLFAAGKLYEEATEDVGLRRRDLVWPIVEKAADRHGVAQFQPKVPVRIEDPKSTIKAFARTTLDDTECFALTLDRLEADLATMRERAEAWAIGDLDLLRRLPVADPGPACIEAVMQASVFSEQGIAELPQRLREAWLEAAEKALSEHRSTFAVLPMRLLLGEDSVLETLAERGYAVQEPE